MDNNKRLAVADIVDRLRFPLTGSSWLKLSAAAELAQVLERAQSHIGVLRAAIDEKTREVEYEQRRRQQTAEDKAKLFATANDLAEENVALRAQVERAVALLGNDGGGSYMRIRQIIRAGRTRGGLAVSKRRRKTSEVKPNR